MRVAFDGVTANAPAVDLRDTTVTAAEALDAVRNPADDSVQCARPAPVHERVGLLHRGVSVSPVAALAAAARTWGARTEHDAELRSTEAELRALDIPDVDLEAARRRVAETEADVAALRERVARVGGEVDAHRELSVDPSDAEATHQAATRDLASAETEQFAAREALAAAQERARDARDAREHRLELEDRRENLRRAARRVLADEYAASFTRAVAALPVPGVPAPPTEFDGPSWAAAVAVARVTRPGAPLVVAELFDRASRARAALDAPVLLVEL